MRFFIIICLWCTFLVSPAQKSVNEVYYIENSSVKLIGESNVSGYCCNLFDLSNNANVPIKSLREGKMIEMEKAIVELQTKGFKCDNKAMTKDFLKALKADTYPIVRIEFLSFQLNELVEMSPVQKNVKASIKITLAGAEKTYNIYLNQIQFRMDEFTITGRKKVTMSDFEITPPTALLGMVQVEDEIELEFDITFKLMY